MSPPVLFAIFFITSIALSLYYKGETRKVASITEAVPLTQTAPAVPSVPDASAENEAQNEVATEESATASVAEENSEVTVEEIPATPASNDISEQEVPAETPEVPAAE